jgi:hypothetical protein
MVGNPEVIERLNGSSAVNFIFAPNSERTLAVASRLD